jgi:N-acetylmuramoyl-L-alanine amidase
MKFLTLYKIKNLAKTNQKNVWFCKTDMFMTQKIISIFLALMTIILLNAEIAIAQSSGMKIRTVVIDPGHGGADPGAVGKFSKESHLVLKMSLMLGEMIENAYPDVKVIYTRTDDSFVELYKRAEIANKNNADLFICVHVNASTSPTPYGTETFVMGVDKTGANLNVAKLENSVILKEDNYLDKYDGFDPNDPETHIIFSLYQNANLTQSLLFAQAIQDNFTKNVKRNNRGVKQAGFLVLWKTTMPSVLIELGFISNVEEEKYLNSAEGQQKLSKAMFDAFVSFKTNYEEGETSSVDKPENNVADNAQNTSDNAQNTSDNTANIDQSGIVFKIQVSSSSKKIEISPKNFNGYQNVDVYLQDGVYKYTIGAEVTYDKIVELHTKVKKDYTDSFIIAFKNGVRIPLNQAKSEANEK